MSDWTVACTGCPYRAADLGYESLPRLFWTTMVGDLEVWAWNRDHLAFLNKFLKGEPTDRDAYGWFGAYVPGAWQRHRARIVKAIRERWLVT